MNILGRAYNTVKNLVSYPHPLDNAPSYIASPNHLIRGTTSIVTYCDLPIDNIIKNLNGKHLIKDNLSEDSKYQPTAYDALIFNPSSSLFGPAINPNCEAKKINFNIQIPLECITKFYVFENSYSLDQHKPSDILDPRLFPDTYLVQKQCENFDLLPIDHPSENLYENPYDCSFVLFCKLCVFLNDLSPKDVIESMKMIANSFHPTTNGCLFTLHMMFYKKDVKRIFYIFNCLYPKSCDFYDNSLIIREEIENFSTKDNLTDPIKMDSFTITNVSEIVNVSKIIDQTHIINILPHIPKRYKNHTLRLVYSSDINGTSLKNMYRLVNQYEEDIGFLDTPYVLFIKDSKNKVFGAYMNIFPHISRSYFGTGECFVFTYAKNKSINIYHWNASSSSNFVFCDSKYIDIGSKDGRSAIWIDENLYQGRSQSTEIFNNNQLSSSEYFTIYAVELWNFVE